MRKLLYLSTALLFINCTQNTEVPEGSSLIAKYKVFDENISPKLDVCSNDKVKSFKDYEGWECMFKLEELTFEVEYKIVLSKDGHMSEFHGPHSVTNNIDFKKFGIAKDTLDPKKLTGNDISIKIATTRSEIIDGSDTLEIEKIYPAEKLIFVKEKTKNGRRNIYEYKNAETEINNVKK